MCINVLEYELRRSGNCAYQCFLSHNPPQNVRCKTSCIFAKDSSRFLKIQANDDICREKWLNEQLNDAHEGLKNAKLIGDLLKLEIIK